MTDKSDDWVGHLNTILAREGGNLNDPVFKSSNSRALPGKGGGMLKLRVDRRITLSFVMGWVKEHYLHVNYKTVWRMDYSQAIPQQMYIPAEPQMLRSDLVNSLKHDSPMRTQITTKLKTQKPTVAQMTSSLATPSNSSLTGIE